MARPLKIWQKLILGFGLVVGIIALLMAGTLYGLLSYLSTIKTVDSKLAELGKVGELRFAVNQLTGGPWGKSGAAEDDEYWDRIKRAREKLDAYRAQLKSTVDRHRDPDDGHEESDQVKGIEERFAALEEAIRNATKVGSDGGGAISDKDSVQKAVTALVFSAADLQNVISTELSDVIESAKQLHKYSMIVVISTGAVGVLLMLCLLTSFYRWVFDPVRELQQGARRLGGGDFDHPIELHSGDEMEDLAAAFNTMTGQLREIYRDLERQVNERSRQLVRSERLASVGFLAAGVAHEINNPLQAITLYSGALDARLNELARKRPADAQDFEVLCRYLKTILEEAFRCKRITERLLEFSRGGDSKREQVELCGLVEAVLQVARPLQSARGKEIVFSNPGKVWAWVNSDEMKSVVLNLVVNALDSMDESGTLTIEVVPKMGEVELSFRDTGCGMTAEVLENIFEPFYTQSRSGKGTGLGLTISHRIVAQHGGAIEAASAGPDRGSTFTVRLPLQPEAAAAEPTRPRIAA